VPYDFLRLSPEFKAFATNDRFRRALAVARGQFDGAVALLTEAERRSELPPFLQQPMVELLRRPEISAGQRPSRE
jgi:hypothetical protein